MSISQLNAMTDWSGLCKIALPLGFASGDFQENYVYMCRGCDSLWADRPFDHTVNFLGIEWHGFSEREAYPFCWCKETGAALHVHREDNGSWRLFYRGNEDGSDAVGLLKNFCHVALPGTIQVQSPADAILFQQIIDELQVERSLFGDVRMFGR